MLKATEEIINLSICLNTDDETEITEYIITLYAGIRLKPLIGILGITETQINHLTNLVTDLYFDYDLTIDIVVNAIYNYINKNKKCPPEQLLIDGIEIFLKEYANE